MLTYNNINNIIQTGANITASQYIFLYDIDTIGIILDTTSLNILKLFDNNFITIDININIIGTNIYGNAVDIKNDIIVSTNIDKNKYINDKYISDVILNIGYLIKGITIINIISYKFNNNNTNDVANILDTHILILDVWDINNVSNVVELIVKDIVIVAIIIELNNCIIKNTWLK